MEMVMTEGFVELSMVEMEEIDGGGVWAAIGAGLMKAGAVVGTACGVGATGGLIIIGVGAAALVTGVVIGCTQ